MVRHSLSALALALLLAGCNRVPPIDTTDPEARKASIEQILGVLPPPTAERFKAAVAKVDADTPIPGTAETLHWRRFDNPSVADFLAVVEGLTTPPPQREVDPDWPNPANSSRLLRSYVAEQQILEDRRKASLEAGQQLVDQFPLTDFRFAPPSDRGGLSEANARFTFQVANNTRFDAYRPKVRVSILLPGEDKPVFEREFVEEGNDLPIDPGAYRDLEFQCCGAISDPFHYEILTRLPVGTQVTAELVNIEDHGRKPMIDMATYSIADENRRLFLGACLTYLEANLATWTPPGPGQECLPEEALEAYQEQATQDQLRQQVAQRLSGSSPGG